MMTGLRRLAVGSLVLALLLAPVGVAAQDQAAATPLPAGGTELEPGRYRSDVVGPSIEFEVEDGWLVGTTPEGPIFTLERSDQPGTVVTVTRFDGDVFIDSCDGTSMTQVEPSVARLAEVIGRNPYVVPAPPAAIVVDGTPGIRLDVGVPTYTECDLPFILIWALPLGDGGEFVQLANQQSRFIILEVGGDVVVIAIESFPGAPFGTFLEASMELVSTMRIEPDTSEPPLDQADPADVEAGEAA